MPKKIVYTGKSSQIYTLKESESSTRFLNLQAYLGLLLTCNKHEDSEIKLGALDFFFYNNTALEITCSKKINKIKASGTEKQLSAIEKGLVKKLKQAEASYGEMYGAQPFLQNEKLQKIFNEAVRARHEQFLSNAKNI